jgi:nitroimidazol reductase NimA-like FMN-containing flavoprotein (pyridoxamine 5'-phosphate oxidase superfamily)
MERTSDRTRVRRSPKKGRYEPERIRSILDRALVGNIAFVDKGQPVCIPMLYARIEDRLYIHGSRASRMMRLLSTGAPACFTMTVVDGIVLARSAFEHSANYESVVAFGTFEEVTGKDERLRALAAFTKKLLPDVGARCASPMNGNSRRPRCSAWRSARHRQRCVAVRQTTMIAKTPLSTCGRGSCPLIKFFNDPSPLQDFGPTSPYLKACDDAFRDAFDLLVAVREATARSSGRAALTSGAWLEVLTPIMSTTAKERNQLPRGHKRSGRNDRGMAHGRFTTPVEGGALNQLRA